MTTQAANSLRAPEIKSAEDSVDSAPAETEAPASFDSGAEVDYDQLVDMIHADPMAEPEPEPAADPLEGAEGSDLTVAPSEENAAEVKPAQPADPQPAQQPAVDPRAIADAVAEGVARANPKPEQNRQPEGPKGPDFNGVQIPQQVIAAMEHEDASVRAQGYQALVGGMGNLIHQQTMQQVGGIMQQVVQAIPQMVQQHMSAQTQQSSVKQDFYGAYPQYDKQELRPMVLRVASQVMQEQGARSWTPEIRDAVGQRLNTLFSSLSGQPAQQAPVAPAPTPATPPSLSRQTTGGRVPSGPPASDDPNSLFYGLTPLN